MDTQKVVVILLIVAILMSVISIVMSLSTITGLEPITIPTITKETIRNIFFKVENAGPDGGSIGVTILPPPNNSGGGA